jgi:hypothetical protein
LAARERDAVSAQLLLGLPAFPDQATARGEVSRLGLLARLTVAGSDIARLVCQAMCLLRPLAVTIGPLVIRDLPPGGRRRRSTSHVALLQPDAGACRC